MFQGDFPRPLTPNDAQNAPVVDAIESHARALPRAGPYHAVLWFICLYTYSSRMPPVGKTPIKFALARTFRPYDLPIHATPRFTFSCIARGTCQIPRDFALPMPYLNGSALFPYGQPILGLVFELVLERRTS